MDNIDESGWGFRSPASPLVPPSYPPLSVSRSPLPVSLFLVAQRKQSVSRSFVNCIENFMLVVDVRGAGGG